MHRTVFEVPGNTDDSTIQAMIDAATASGMTRPIVHLAQGYYAIRKPLHFPEGSDIQLVGDGLNGTKLYWEGSSIGSVAVLPHTNVTIADLTIDSKDYEYGSHATPNPGNLDGVQITFDDQPSESLIADQLFMQGGNNQSFSEDGLEHMTVNLFSTYMQGAQTGISVSGGEYRNAGQATLGRTDYFTGSHQSEGDGTSFNVTQHGRLLIQDNWHDDGGTSPHNFELTGSGTVTEQGGGVFLRGNPGFIMNNFDGDVTLMNLSVNAGINVAAQSAHTNVLTLGLAGPNSSFLPTGGGSVTVANVIDGFYAGAYSQISTDSPDVSWMRRMLGQVRSEQPRPSSSTEGGRTTFQGRSSSPTQPRLDRVQILGMSNAVHLIKEAPHSGLFLSITGAAGQLTATSACVATSSGLNIGPEGQWVLEPAGEGDFTVSPVNDRMSALTTALSADATWINILRPLTQNDYKQHWDIQSTSDGQVTLQNRGTGLFLSLGSGSSGCTTTIQASLNSSTKWNINAN